MKNSLVLFAGAAFALAPLLPAQDYKLEMLASAPSDLPAAYVPLIAANGYRVTGAAGPKCEVWFRKSIPTGAQPADNSIVFGIAQGTFLGVVRYAIKGEDRRGQLINPGLYTLRYSNYPVDGAHQGVAPQRDFALMTPIGSDADPNSTPAFRDLVQMSTKASGSPHPAVLSLESPNGDTFPALVKEGDTPDWVLCVKIGDLKIAIILVGRVQL
jgi:hypothetical protein